MFSLNQKLCCYKSQFSRGILRSLLMVPAAMAIIGGVPGALAKDQAYDWVMEIQTKKLKRQFYYTSSNLQDQIVKCDVFFYPVALENNAPQDRYNSPQTVHYKKMWHYKSKTLGLEQTHEFSLPPNQGFAIKISHKDNVGSDIEDRAAADAILRLAIDLYVRKQHLVSVRVPQDSYHKIADGLLNDKGFQYSPQGNVEQPVDSKMSIFMTSDSDANLKDTFVYL